MENGQIEVYDSKEAKETTDKSLHEGINVTFWHTCVYLEYHDREQQCRMQVIGNNTTSLYYMCISISVWHVINRACTSATSIMV